jgi:WD40 repeat protein
MAGSRQPLKEKEMVRSKRPYFRLESRFENEAAGEPELFSLSEAQGEWKVSRREFVATAAALGVLWAGLLTNKTSGQDQEENILLEMEVLHSHTAAVGAIAFSPNGKGLASGADDEKIKIWDVSSKTLLKTIDARMAVQCLCFTPDGRYLVAGGTSSANRPGLLIYDANSGDVFKNLGENGAQITAVACDPEGKILASGSKDKTIKVWEIKSGSNLLTLRKHKGEILALVFSPDGKNLISGSTDKQVKIWDSKNGRLLKTLEDHTGSVYALDISPDGKTIASGGAEQTIMLWDRMSGDILKKIQADASVFSLAYSPNGLILVSGGADKIIRIWDGASGYSLGTLEGHTGAVHGVAFSPLDLLVASASADKSVRLWNAAAGELVSIFFDPAATAKGNSAISYKYTDLNGQTVNNVLRCSAPLPAGAICTCNCIPGTYVPSIPLPTNTGTCGVVCQCNKICTCIPVV